MTQPPTPIPSEAVGAHAPTSRATFRFVIKTIGATNREADALRHALLELADADELAARLRSLDRTDPMGSRGAEPRLALWFAAVDPGTGRLVSADDPILAVVSEEFATRLSEVSV